MSTSNGHARNMDAMDEFEPYLSQLKELPFVRDAYVTTRPQGGSLEFDAEVEVRTPEGPTLFLVENKRSHLSQEVAERLLHIRATQPNLLLFCPLVGRGLAERFGRGG